MGLFWVKGTRDGNKERHGTVSNTKKRVEKQNKPVRKSKSIKERIEELEKETEAAEIWIHNLPEGEERNIIEMRYIDGMTQADIAEAMGEGHTREEVAKKLERFWKKQK